MFTKRNGLLVSLTLGLCLACLVVLFAWRNASSVQASASPEGVVSRHDTAVAAPAILVAPLSLEAWLHPDEHVTQTLWITNTGDTDLTFTIQELSRRLSTDTGPRSRPLADPLVDPDVWAQVRADGRVEAILYLRELADLSQVNLNLDWEGRGHLVYERLLETKERSGAELFAWLEGRGAAPRRLLAANAILATLDASSLEALAERPEIAHIGANSLAYITPMTFELLPATVEVVEWNIAKIRADQVWSTFGITGQGTVIGIIDTGVMYTHAALEAQYRGNLGGGSFEHDYNWYDLINGQVAPYDDNGHGTMGIGIAVGDDGGANQIGAAPGAQWIAVKAISGGGSVTLADLHAAMDWMLAPTDLGGNNPDPSKRPHIGLGMWGRFETCSPEFQPDLLAWRAAGILPVFGAAGDGPACSGITSEADLPEVVTAGATDANDIIAPSSPRGPSACGVIKPDVSAPGVNIRTSNNAGGYQTTSGTSWSAAHLAGAAGLVLSANPALGLEDMLTTIYTTAVPLPNAQCGDPGPPNNVYGWGRIDAFEAVSLTLGYQPGYDLPWLSETPISGTLAPGAGLSITVVFDAAGLDEGTYLGALDVESNDPATPHVSVPVTLTLASPCQPVTGTWMTWEPITPTVGQVITFTAGATGTATITFTWDFDDGAQGAGETVTHTYEYTGSYGVVLTATNACGVQIVKEEITIEEELPCTPIEFADFTWTPITPTVGQVVTFTAYTSGTGAIAFDWDFGNGDRAQGIAVTYTYPQVGNYTVTLTATNECDSWVVVRGVTVAAVEQPVHHFYLPLVAGAGPARGDLPGSQSVKSILHSELLWRKLILR